MIHTLHFSAFAGFVLVRAGVVTRLSKSSRRQTCRRTGNKKKKKIRVCLLIKATSPSAATPIGLSG